VSFLLDSFQFGEAGAGPPPPPPTPTSTQWRILFTGDTVTPGATTACMETDMRLDVGGADQCSGGTPAASSSHGTHPPSFAFDNDTNSHWRTIDTGLNNWLQYTFGSTKAIDQFWYRNWSVGQAPLSMELQYWDGAAWVTWISTGAISWASDGETKFFSN